MRTKLELALRIALSAVLAYAGIQKLLAPHDFVEQVANYQWLPERAPWIAVALPPIEVVTALSMWLPLRAWRQAAAGLAALLFAGFTAAVVRAVWLEINVDCGCFGAGSGDVGPLTIARNVALTTGAIALAALGRADRPAPASAP